MTRLIDADELNEYIGRESLDTREKIFALVDRIPTLPNPCGKPCAFERPHGEWINFTLEGGFFSSHKCSNCGFNGNQLWHFCPSCGALMRVKYELNRVSEELNSEIEKANSEIEKANSEIENSNLPERFTATDCSCLNCKNRHSVHCEPQYKKIYGYCGNWERR